MKLCAANAIASASAAGTPLKAVFTAGDESVTVRSEITLAPASKRALDVAALREQLGRLGETPFALGSLALGAFAVGALAIGALAVGKLEVRKARLREVEIDSLMVRRFSIADEDTPEGSAKL